MFRILPWACPADSNALTFQFESTALGRFAETVTFPDDCSCQALAASEIGQSVIDLAAYYIGISYYKAAAENTLHGELPLTAAGRASVEALYTHGLGEFYARNQLAFPPDIEFDITERASLSMSLSDIRPHADAHVAKSLQPLVAFGGGKDSHVAVSLLQRSGTPVQLVSVVLADRVKQRLSAMTDQSIQWIHRQIDPQLIALNQSGQVYNGHIPITAINSILLTIMALGTGANAVVFANERGASVATREYGGQAVNHQYSKSLDFERLFRAALWSVAEDRLDYFSILRGYSELWIANYAATQIHSQHQRLASCNRNFVFNGPNALPAEQRWCGRCSKCVFSAIVFAPHLNRDAFVALFDSDILNNPDNLDHAKDLTGLGSAKPWECVGDVADTASALAVLGEHPDWARSVVVASLMPLLSEHYDLNALKQRFQDELISYTQNCVPERLHATLLEAL